MLIASVLDFKYCRTLTENVDIAFTQSLKENFDYSFVVSYGDFYDPDFQVISKNSSIIQLEGGVDAMLEKCNPTCRNEIRRAYRMPELNFHIANEERSAAYNLHQESEAERNWFPIPPDEFQNSLVVYMTYQGDPIAGMTCYSSDKRLRIGRIFSRRQAKQWSNVQKIVFSASARRIVHELSKIGIERGFKTLDLGGIDLDDPQKAGITQFKLSFGGEILPVIIGRFEKPHFTARKPDFLKMGLDVT